MWHELLQQLQQGDTKALARTISFIENEQPGYEVLLQSLRLLLQRSLALLAPPGAGKSTLVDSLIGSIG